VHPDWRGDVEMQKIVFEFCAVPGTLDQSGFSGREVKILLERGVKVYFKRYTLSFYHFGQQLFKRLHFILKGLNFGMRFCLGSDSIL